MKTSRGRTEVLRTAACVPARMPWLKVSALEINIETSIAINEKGAPGFVKALGIY